MERFNSSIKGYNVKQVNKFVDETLKEYASMLQKLKSKDAEIFALKQEIEKYKALNEITSSYETNSYLKDVARNEAKEIIENAKKNASRIVNDALLEAERTELQADNLKRNMTIFKRKLRNALQIQLQSVEDLDDIKLDE